MSTHYSEIDVQPGLLLKVYSKNEAQDFEKKWRDIFCKQRQGANTKAYKWHIFSFNKYPSASGIEARNQYLKQKASEFIVLSNDYHLAVSTDILPEECNLSDYYVFPENMAWTMAFTHEDGWLGPYFALHPRYDLLNKENLERIQKKKEIENAKKKGWL